MNTETRQFLVYLVAFTCSFIALFYAKNISDTFSKTVLEVVSAVCCVLMFKKMYDNAHPK